MTITRGEALEMLCKELKIDGKRAQDLIATLPSPYPGDESFPGPIIADLIDRNRPPQTAEEFAALGRSETSSPPALQKNIKQIAIGTGPNGCAVVALDDENKLWLWVEGGIMFHELPPVISTTLVGVGRSIIEVPAEVRDSIFEMGREFGRGLAEEHQSGGDPAASTTERPATGSTESGLSAANPDEKPRRRRS
jgi:hypothetical protein